MRKYKRIEHHRVRRQGKKRSGLRRVTVLFAIILFLAAAVLWILNTEHIIQGNWSSILPIVFTILATIFALGQWLFPISPTITQEPLVPLPPTFEQATSQMLLDRAKDHYNAQRYNQALSTYQEVLERDRNCKEAYHGLGLVFLKLRSVEKTFVAFEIAERLQGRYHERETTVPGVLSTQRNYNIRTSVIVESAGSSSVDGKAQADHKDSFFGVQDVLSIGKAFGFFGVVDGRPTGNSGQDASNLAIQAIISYVLPKVRKIATKELESDAPKTILVEGIQQANQVVFQHQVELHTDMGTSIIVALVIGKTVYIAQVGDSLAYLYRKEAGLIKITRDQSVVADSIDHSIITNDNLGDRPKYSQIYHNLGEKPSIEVDFYTKTLELNDKVLLCSRSLYSRVGTLTIRQIMSESMFHPSELVEALIQAASNGGGQVNISAIILHVIESTKNLEKGI